MRSRICALVLAAVILLVPVMLLAEEGMWMIDQLDKLPWKNLQTMGLQLSARQIYDGKGGGIAYAIVSLGGGTGSFVSPNGLILTNHHVALGALQRTSSTEHNYLVNGFNSASYEEEIPAPGYRASVLVSIEDVTLKVLSAVTDSMGDLARYNAIEKRIKEIVKYGEEGRDAEAGRLEVRRGAVHGAEEDHRGGPVDHPQAPQRLEAADAGGRQVTEHDQVGRHGRTLGVPGGRVEQLVELGGALGLEHVQAPLRQAAREGVPQLRVGVGDEHSRAVGATPGVGQRRGSWSRFRESPCHTASSLLSADAWVRRRWWRLLQGIRRRHTRPKLLSK